MAITGHAEPRQSRTQARVKLVLTIVVDRFREDYITPFRRDYKGGLAQLLLQGAVIPDAHQDHYPTVTAPGHATVLTGSVPTTGGIIRNEWYDRVPGKMLTCVEDASASTIGNAQTNRQVRTHPGQYTALVDDVRAEMNPLRARTDGDLRDHTCGQRHVACDDR